MARKRVLSLLLAAFLIAGASVAVAQASTHGRSHRHDGDRGSGGGPATATPVKHLVVIFQENVSFDHYFATYPFALNPPGEPHFVPSPKTPSVVNNLRTAGLLNHNPNSALPFRIDRSRSLVCDNNHTYTAEQNAYDGGKTDKFVESTFPPDPNFLFPYFIACERQGEMGYFDGNTVTALWNYAQHFSMSDNFFGSTFGPSTPGHIN